MMRPNLAGLLLSACGLLCSAASSAAESPLADAVEARDLDRVTALLDAHADPNPPQTDGMTALLWAVHHDDLPTTKRLLAAGADVALSNRYGVTALPLACQNGNADLVNMLLDAGADPNTTQAGGETVLMTAARTGSAPCVAELLKRGATIDAKERRGQSALMWACAEGHAEVVDLLLKAGADFKASLKSGFTPLLFAVREGRLEVVRLLIAAGADADEAVAEGGGTKLRGGTAPLVLAVENAHYELALALVVAGADPNDLRSGFAPLHAITWVRKTGFGDNEEGNPAPPGSGSVSSLEFVRGLAAFGADLNLRIKNGSGGRGTMDTTGATPFLLGARNDDLPFMKLLVELGADPTIPNVDDCTPLMAAAGIGTLAPGEEAGSEQEALDTVAWLLSLGADLNAVDRNGESAMHGAAYKSLPRMVRFLDERGAEIETWNRKNKYGWTPLVIAQGFRPGNFKPAEETIAALSEVMRAHGIDPPPPPSRDNKVRGYQP